MFSFNVAIILALAASALAHPASFATRNNICSGTLQCCDSISPAGAQSNVMLGGLIPINIQGLNIPIGLNCNPISVGGAGSAGTCDAQAACCKDVTASKYGLDCDSIDIGL